MLIKRNPHLKSDLMQEKLPNFPKTKNDGDTYRMVQRDKDEEDEEIEKEMSISLTSSDSDSSSSGNI